MLLSCHTIKLESHTAIKPFIAQVQVFPFAKENRPNYRIPAIVKAENGDLLIFAEKRRKSVADVGYTDIVMTRSTDGGTSWKKEILLFGGNNESHADPTTLVDRINKKIYLFFLRDKKQYYMMYTADNRVNPPPDSVSKAMDWKCDWHQGYGISVR